MSKSKTATLCLLTTLLLLLSTVPVWAADKNKDEETLRNAATVLQAMLGSKDVPASVVAKADCVIVLPSVKKFAVGIGGSGGRGPMSCRTGKNFTGKWSAPAMYSIGGASAGIQLGGSSTDYVVLLMDTKAVEAVWNGKAKVGSDVTAAAGPSGATANTMGGSDVLTYARAKGLFAGVSLDGASLDPDSDANQRLYGKAISAKEITSGGDLKVTSAGEQLVNVLNTKAPKHME